MPNIADKIREQLNLEKKYDLEELEKNVENHEIGPVKTLFTKIEDKTIQELQKKYAGKQETKENESKNKKEIKTEKNKETKPKTQNKQNQKKNTEIQTKENTNQNPEEIIQNLDLRVAEITSVEKHPDADKLYIEKINLGNEEKTIISGLAENYTKEELIGKKIILVYNLKPAKLRGILSQGMLLAVTQGEQVGLALCPEADPGTKLTFKKTKTNEKLETKEKPTQKEELTQNKTIQISTDKPEINIEQFFSIQIKTKNGKITCNEYELTGTKIIIDKNLEGTLK